VSKANWDSLRRSKTPVPMQIAFPIKMSASARISVIRGRDGDATGGLFVHQAQLRPSDCEAVLAGLVGA
jgi:hypothetical protein